MSTPTCLVYIYVRDDGRAIWNEDGNTGGITIMIKLHRWMVSVLASSAVDRWFELRSGPTKDYEIGIEDFSAKHAIINK
jgi:hypothetical protein